MNNLTPFNLVTPSPASSSFFLVALLICCGSLNAVRANSYPLLNTNQLHAGGGEDYDARGINYEFGQIPFVRAVRRLGSEFLGKRAPSSLEDETVDPWEPPAPGPASASSPGGDMEADSAPSHPYYSSSMDKRARIRMGSEFLGKRRLGSEFLGKRSVRNLGSEFLGKRSNRGGGGLRLASSPFGADWSWKRARLGSEFLGKKKKRETTKEIESPHL